MADDESKLVGRLLREIRSKRDDQRRAFAGLHLHGARLHRRMEDASESVACALGRSARVHGAAKTAGQRPERLSARQLEGRRAKLERPE